MVCVDGASINRALSKHASEATCCREFVQGTRMSYLNACCLNVFRGVSTLSTQKGFRLCNVKGLWKKTLQCVQSCNVSDVG